MKNLLTYTVLLLIPVFLTSSKAPTSTNLADELVGVYTGMFAKNGNLDKAYQIEVTKLSPTSIMISPIDGNNSKSFHANLEEDNLSALRIIRLIPTDNIALKNGMMTPVNGRLSYGISNSGGEPLEIFSGLKK